MSNRKIALSSVKPTGRPHIGNYFGAMKQFVEMSEEYDSYIFIANYHALTTVKDPKELRNNSIELAKDYLAIGLDPKKVTLFLQSDVPLVTELAWIFNTLITVPYLKRSHAYKDAISKEREVNVGIFTYPILMAADILIYDADVVPVGNDQKQHLEIARDIADKFNRQYDGGFKLPEPLILEEVGTVVGTDGRKMSKSYNNTISLFASDADIKTSILRMPTDSKKVSDPKNPEECDVFSLHRLFSKDDLQNIKKRYVEGGIGYKESKDILIENARKFISPLREARAQYNSKEDYVLQILKAGAKKANERARAKMDKIKDIVGVKI